MDKGLIDWPKQLFGRNNVQGFSTPHDKPLETCSLVHDDLVVRLTPKMMRAHAKLECVVTRTRQLQSEYSYASAAR